MFFTTICNHNSTSNSFANSKISERDRLIEKLKNYPFLLAYANDKYKDDIDVVRIAIKQNPRALKYASKRLQDNEALVREAVQKNGQALAYASPRLQDNDDIVSTAINHRFSHYLKYASKRLQNNNKIVLMAIKISGRELRYASNRLRDDKLYVTLAIKNHPLALEYASKHLQNDKALVLLAIRNASPTSIYAASSSLAYASHKLQDDKEIVLKAVKKDGVALRYASKRLRNDKEVVSLALKNNKHNLSYASEALQKEFGFVKNEIDIKLDSNACLTNIEAVPLGIKSTLALKDIQIWNESTEGKFLVGKYKITKGEPIDYFTILNINHGRKTSKSKLIIVLEEISGEKHIVEKECSGQGYRTFSERTQPKDKDYVLNSLTGRYNDDAHGIRLAIADKIAYAYFFIAHPMLGEKDAKALDIKANYIKHIVAKIDNKIVFDFHTSAMFKRKLPIFNFTFNTPKKSGKLEIIVTDNQGNKKNFYKAYEI